MITGASGFVGVHLAQMLLNQGDRIVALSLRGKWPHDAPPAVKSLPLTAIDITNGNSFRQILAQTKPDCIFHLAAQANVPESFRDPEGTWRVNYYGSRTLFDAVNDVVPDATILLVSTGNVYGQALPSEMPITERCVTRASTPYAQSKLAADLLALHYVKQMGSKIVIARPFNHAGPGQSSSYVLSHFARQIARLEKRGKQGVLLVGNLDVYRDFSDVRDVVRAYGSIVVQGRPGDIFNIASGQSVLLHDVLDRLLAMSECRIEVRQDSDLLRSQDLLKVEVSTQALRERTGWRPEITLQKTLRDTLQYWRQQDHD